MNETGVSATNRDPAQTILSRLFFDAVAEHADRRAVVHGDDSMCYADLAREMETIAGQLRSEGIGAGDVVGVVGGTARSVAVLLGIWEAGAVALPLDPALPSARRAAMLAEAGAAVVYESDSGAPHVRPAAERLYADSADSADTADAAYVVFTSGSTGLPKGVLGTHSGLAHFVMWQRDTFGIGPGDRVAQLTSWSFDVMLREILTPLIAGATVVLPPSRSAVARDALLFARDHRITVLHAVPSLVRRWLAVQEVSLPELRAVFFAGETLDSDLVRAWRGTVSARADIVNLYGPTETTLAKCFHVVGEQPPPGPQPVGRPLPGCRVAVVVPGGWDPCPPGGEGEIVLTTEHRTAGYLERGAATFVPGPDGALAYRTGDRGTVDKAGLLTVTGRLDDQVKIRGVRLDLRAVEAVLAGAPAVRQAAVVDVPAADGQTELAAYLVTSGPVDLDALRSEVVTAIGSAAIPRVIAELPELPLSPNGKVDRAELRARPLPAGTQQVTPSEVEDGEWQTKLVAEVCQTVLGTAIGPDDDLFMLGADSMAALEIAARLQDSVGFEVPLGLVFDCLTAAGIAARLVELDATALR